MPAATPAPRAVTHEVGRLSAQRRVPQQQKHSPQAQHISARVQVTELPKFEWYSDEAEDQVDASPAPTPAFIAGRDDQPSVPLSQLGSPTFPPQYPSCRKCQKSYSSISSCMEASSVFANATSIFNNPLNYIAVIKCACTDTFQAVYPQCVDCFQHTDQCWWLGTDPKGTGAPQLVTNIRQICGFGSALLGGVAGANGMNHSHNVSIVPTYTDVSTTAAGYIDQSAGSIFGAAASLQAGSASVVALLSTAAAGIFLLW
ncbi:hypothetical protein K437DRAFT_270171 [Tilletiaria anomala UBC 951]|uniref:Uncharacterized protein n=1 Tax=Tilletiaria anomala (strain ATCC 24038 / CBS 436.72 / UBC 951) TaxID=1037660 RepID=A0A066VM83_TILAU|nr:uncharacterized protein K437DRAFT_270171 [Tilletiaria anomala UBC 951]KDN39844.1 hypothetical protein K437DRAFT_270171 [Tilletiaria anomala UBC 951]